MLSPTALLIVLLLFTCTAIVRAADVRVGNDCLELRFDPATGAWTHLIDKSTGQDLAAAACPGVPAELALSELDLARLNLALVNDQAHSLEGNWRFFPEPATAEAAELAGSRFDDSTWVVAPIPSRAETGDKKLRGQVGAFWYRRTFTVPAAWEGHDLAIIIGAVDDFDTTYFNGRTVGATTASTPRWWEAPRRYVIPANCVLFGRQNTIAIRVYNGGYDGGIAGPVMVGRADTLPAPVSSVKLLAHELSADGRTLKMSLRAGAYKVQSQYAMQADSAIIARRFTLENASQQPQTLHGAGHVLPALMPGDNPVTIFPDSLPDGDRPFGEISEEKPTHPTSQNALVYLFSQQAGRGVGVWFHSEEEYAHLSVSRSAGAIVCHNLRIAARLAPGESVQLGTQYIWLAHGSRDQVLRSIQPIYAAIGLRPPVNPLDRLRERILYCGHPGGMPETHFRGYGGFKALEAYLPTLKKMGVDVLWLLPIFEHGDGKKWNLYSPFDHFKISSLYGTEEELKRLATSARAAGVDLMFDLVPHGPPDHTPLAKEHPEWVCQTEDGKPTYVWGQLAFDNAHPGWQDYMRRAAEHHAREFGVIGARVDVAAGSPPNWNPKAGYRPSQSTLGGGLGMDRAIREGFARVHPRVLLLPEEYTGSHVFYRDADLTYDAQLFYLFVELQAKDATPERWAERLSQFLHDQSLVLPPGAVKMRWTANHDTVSWTFQKKRTRDAYGPARARALLALCCLIDGVPMIYQGEEDPSLYGGKGEAITDDLAKIIACRKRLAALSRGEADYRSVQATDGILGCLRKLGNQQVLVLVSFNPRPVRSQVRYEVPHLLKEWRDELSGEIILLDAVPMADHQIRVLAHP